MAETLGYLCDKLTIVKLKQYHCDDESKARSLSGQCSMLVQENDCVVIISTHLDFASPDRRILNGKQLSYRENAELSHYCSLFLGCFSGITWLMTTDAAKKLPMVLFIGGKNGIFASLAEDHAYSGKPVDSIIETDSASIDAVTETVLAAVDDFKTARGKYNKKFRQVFWKWITFIDYRRGVRSILGSYRTLGYFISRNGLRLADILDLSPVVPAFRQAFRIFVTDKIRPRGESARS